MIPASLSTRYRARRVLGRGGFGVVVEAEDVATGRLVAVKTLERLAPVELERFQREARLLARVRHPGVVQVLDFGVAGEGEPYLVMELVSGGELPRSGWSVAGVVDLVEQAAAALDELHRLGLVHRDLKLGNLLRRDDGSVVLADFGLARTIQEGSTVTQEGMVVGTPAYMAPELWAEAAATPASDQFALAALACRLLSGEGVYPEGEPFEVGRAALGPGAQVPAGVPQHLRRPLSKGLAREPALRFSTCGALAAALREGVGATAEPAAITRTLGRATVPRAPTGETTGRRRRAPTRGRLGPIVAILVGAVAVGYLSVQPKAAPARPPAATRHAEPVDRVDPRPPPDPAALRVALARLQKESLGVGRAMGLERGFYENWTGSRGFREALVRRARPMAKAWKRYVEALAAVVKLEPEDAALREVFTPAHRFLETTSGTSKLLANPIRAGFEFQDRQRQEVSPFVEDMLRSSETALSPLLAQAADPGLRLCLVSLLLLTGYPDPVTLLDAAKRAGREVRHAGRVNPGLYLVALSLGDIAGNNARPCEDRRQWTAWGLEVYTAPAYTGSLEGFGSWALGWAELLKATHFLSNHECRDQEPNLGPALAGAVARYVALREGAPSPRAEQLKAHDSRLRQYCLQVPIHVDIVASMERLQDLLGVRPKPGEILEAWRRGLTPRPR